MRRQRPPFAAICPRWPDELGDLLLQVVYHARMAEERGAFAFADVARGIADKMIRRRIRMCSGDAAGADPTETWEEQKLPNALPAPRRECWPACRLPYPPSRVPRS